MTAPQPRTIRHPAEFKSFVAVAASYHSVAVKNDGTVWTWGPRENKGSTPGGSVMPVKVSGFDQATAVAAGYEHNLVIKSDTSVWAWGDNRYGQLGDRSGTDQESPVRVRNLDGVTTVAAGRGHSLALKADGSVWGWGGNYHGQLGTGDRNALDAILPSKPIAVDGFTGTGIISAAAGFDTTYAVDGSQRVWVRGNNSFGQLGPGTDDVIDTVTPSRSRMTTRCGVGAPTRPVSSAMAVSRRLPPRPVSVSLITSRHSQPGLRITS